MSLEPNDQSSTMVLVVRTDLKMSSGKLVAQAGHAAVEVALKARGTAMFERWRQAGSRKISLIAPDSKLASTHLQQVVGERLY